MRQFSSQTKRTVVFWHLAFGTPKKMPSSISAWSDQKMHETIRHLLESEPVIRTFNVHSSTSHKIAASKAAGSRG